MLIPTEYIMTAAAVLGIGGLVLHEVKQETTELAAEFRGTLRQATRPPEVKRPLGTPVSLEPHYPFGSPGSSEMPSSLSQTPLTP